MKICIITGTRAEYGLLKKLMHGIKKNKFFQLKIIVTGMHLSKKFGLTYKEIESDGFKIVDKIESLIDSDTESARVKGMGIQIQGLVQSVERIKPDLLLVLGDREEAMSTSLVGSYINIPIAHISGGDRVIGNVDDQIRHAVTKLAHVHFATNRESAERILRLGEQPFRVFDVGNPGLDRLLQIPSLNVDELSSRLGFTIKDGEPLIVLIQHVIS